MSGKKVVIYIAEVLAFIMGAMSAYGGSCPAFNVEAIEDKEGVLYTVMSSNVLIYQICNILTYVGALGIMVAIIGLAMKKEWNWIVGFWSSVLGAVSGFIPYLLIALGGGFTPSIMRVVLYAIVILLLLIPGFKKELTENINSEDKSTSKSSDLAAILFVPGVFMWFQSILVAPSHAVLPHANHGTVIQVGIGMLMMALGVLVYGVSLIKHNKK